ncbi:dTDP-glucose 4,6-dehydratase [compost metagenome]
MTDRPGHDHRYAIDASKISADLDWTPSVTFEQGIEQTVAWYLENQGWWQDILDARYSTQRLGVAHG